jgi:O-antigen/teichoic acid export membrane protein
VPETANAGYTPVVKMGILLLLCTILFQGLITTANGLFQKMLRYELSTIAVVVGGIGSLIVVGLLSMQSTPSLLLFSSLPLIIGSALAAITSSVLIAKARIKIALVNNSSAYSSFFFAALPLGLTLIFNVIYFHIDSIILTISRPTAEVGVYGLAYKVFELILVLPTFFMNALYPSLVSSVEQIEKKGFHQFMQLVKKASMLLSVLSVVAIVITWVGSPVLALIKPDFIDSILGLRILSIGLPFFFLSSLAMWVLIALGKQWKLVTIYGIGMIINMLLNILLVPRIGYTAAAWITVATEFLVLVGSGALVVNELKKH